MSDDAPDGPNSDPEFSRREQLVDFLRLGIPDAPYWVGFVSLGVTGLVAGIANLLFGSIYHDGQAVVVGAVTSLVGLTTLPIGLRLRWTRRNEADPRSETTPVRETRPNVRPKRRL